MKRLFFFFSLSFFFITICFSQNSISNDSITHNLEQKINISQDYYKKIKDLEKIAEAQKGNGEFKKENETHKKILELAKANKDTLYIINYLTNITQHSLYRSQTDEVLAYSSQLLTLLKKDDYYNLAKIKLDRANAFRILQQNNKALKNLFEANELFKKNKKGDDSDDTMRLLFNINICITEIYKRVENYENARKNNDLLIELIKKVTNTKLKLSYEGLYHTINGDILIEQERIKEALETYYKASKIFTKIKDTINISMSQINLGKSFNKNKDYTKSIKHYKQGLGLAKKANKLRIISTLYYLMGNSYGKLNKNETAIKYIDSALVITKENNYTATRINALVNKAKIYENKKEYNLAVLNLNKILSLDDSKSYQKTMATVYKTLSDIYLKTNDTKKSISSLEKHIKINEKLTQKNTDSKIKILETEYNYRNIVSKLDKKETALEIFNIKQERLKMITYFIIIAIVSLFFFITIMILIKRKHEKTKRLVLESKQELLEVKKEALDREVEFKNKNLTNFALQINEKNDSLSQIKSKLKHIKPANSSSKKALFDTLIFINDVINQNKEKIQLYSEIDENNDDFEIKINDRFTNLSNQEKKIVTMVRIGKTSKQISTQLSITVASVDNYRSSIRKKMNVPKKETLAAFIKNI